MKRRFYILFTFFSLLFLFYPGDSELFHIFAYNRRLFEKKVDRKDLPLSAVPIRRTSADPLISAEGAYIIDLASFSPVFAKNEKVSFLPASTTKIITALVAYDLFKPDEVITVKSVNEDGQVMGLVPGERITVEKLMYGLLVHSGNDAAYALADHYGMEKFIKRMNEKAQDLHMTKSRFQNPAGLDADDQYTTPYDLSLAARELLKNKYLSKIVSTKEIIISDEDFKYFHTLTNVNKLLGEIQGIGGLKTGYTESAGENLVSLYRRPDGHELVLIVLKSEDRFQDTRNIVKWIDENITYVNLLTQ